MADPEQEKNSENENSIEIPDVRTLNILYTNDVQGEAEQMAYLATVVKQIRASEPLTLLIDSGNWARGTLLSDKFKGLPMAEIFTALKYDAVGVGEGELYFGSKNLYILEEKAEFPMVSCNLVEEGMGIAPYFLKDYVTLEKGPFKIAITGISRPGDYPGSSFEVKDPYRVLPDVFEKIKPYQPDLLILLSRMGLEGDRALARAFPDLHVIVGGGDARNLEKPERIGKTFICQAGERAQFLGSLAIDMEATIRITSVE